jgi:copper chaperone CopZ
VATPPARLAAPDQTRNRLCSRHRPRGQPLRHVTTRNWLPAPSNLAPQHPFALKRSNYPKFLINQAATYLTPGISTGHRQAAIIEELARLDGINSVVVDLEARRVHATAEQLDDAAVIAAVDQAFLAPPGTASTAPRL